MDVEAEAKKAESELGEGGSPSLQSIVVIDGSSERVEEQQERGAEDKASSREERCMPKHTAHQCAQRVRGAARSAPAVKAAPTKRSKSSSFLSLDTLLFGLPPLLLSDVLDRHA